MWRSKISRDQKRFFIALSLYPLSFFANNSFKFQMSNWENTDLFLCESVHILACSAINLSLSSRVNGSAEF